MADQTSSPVQQARQVPYPTQIYLFSIAGGRCEFQGCNHYLLEHPLTLTKGNYAQEAHIVALRKMALEEGHVFVLPIFIRWRI